MNLDSAQAVPRVDLRARAEELRRAGCALEAIEELSAVNRNAADADIERCLVRLRHAAWAELDRTLPAKGATDEVPDLFEGETGIPEVAAFELTAVMIRSAVQHHGSNHGPQHPASIILITQRLAGLTADATLSFYG